MPYDPNIPPAGTEIDADQMRSQLNGLKALIDAVSSITTATVDGVISVGPNDPAAVTVSVTGNTLHFRFEIPQGQEGQTGPVGQEGPPGPPFAQAVVDAVNTLDPGQPANVGVSFDGTNVRFTFDIPRGNDGNDGPQGPPFAQAVVDGVNTLEPWQNATVDVSFDGSNVRFTFGIPRGNDGIPGEVSLQQLTDAISTTSANTNGVSTLGMVVSDPPTQGEVQQIADKLDELINALRR